MRAEDFESPFEAVNIKINHSLDAPPDADWYHGRLDRQTAEDRLKATNEYGSYLIRESDRRPGSYVLSFYGKTGINHFRITAMCGDFYIGGRQFASLSQLIGYYSSYSDLLKGERLNCPVAPPVPVDDQRRVIATLPYKGIIDTDELDFMKGDIFIVHNELGDGWLWVTSQRTNESGIVYHGLLEELNSVDPIETLEYFHSDITKEEAAEKLALTGQCSFLVRPSDNSPGNYSLFFLCLQKVNRFRIEKVGRQFFMGGRYFDSIASIVERYKKEEIVEGYTLLQPVQRERYFVHDNDEFDNNDSDSIYASIKKSSGPNFFSNRNDRIILKGYINKSQKVSFSAKKWKTMYFILNGTEQQIYFFESVKRSRPKSLIDLNYTSLYPVHESFFGRPHCFQLVVRALNHHESPHYLCADSSDEAAEFIQALRPFCVNTQQRNKDKPIKELWSLTICISEAHNLSVKQIPHPYCVISLNDIRVCRTQVKESPNPVWDEEFVLEDLPPDVDNFKVTIFNKSKRSKDTEVVQMCQMLSEIQEGEMVEEWFNLAPIGQQGKGEAQGTLRVKCRYRHEIVMPIAEYSGMIELLLAKDLEVVLALDCLLPKCGYDRIPLAEALLRIFRHERQEALLIKTLNDLEIHREDTVSTLFRGNSLATTLMEQYMKMTASGFVHAAIRDSVQSIVDNKQCCELNPHMLGENPGEAVTNAQHLLDILSLVVEDVFGSTEQCPDVLRYICRCLQESANAKWEDENVRTRVVSGFIFLRLLCPAIINPRMFNLITETPSDVAVRTLKLVAKSLQNLANLVEFGAKEPYMGVLNPFIVTNKERMVTFLNRLSDVHDNPISNEPISGSIARDLATIHQICASHLTDLSNMAQIQPSLKKLITVITMLSKHKERYMEET
ncbi:ras GTPase-activating protein 1-like isoform X2 [Lineus longissimus]|uniref:ras GTPase-activating protein 1-like isoform X2 n=1 Tax=Lineus longissimus TaxID=88925 RepID=UPI00315D8580